VWPRQTVGVDCPKEGDGLRALASSLCVLVLAVASLAEEDAPASVDAPAAILAGQDEISAPTSRRWPLVARIGVRAGYSFLAAGKGLEYDDGPSLSLHIAMARSAESRISCELAADAAYFDEVDDLFRSFLFSQRLDLLFALPVRHARFQAYLLSGMSAVEELLLDVDGEPLTGNFAVSVNLGGGVNFWEGRLDLRLTESLFVGSDNVAALTTFSVAYQF
jgi:hypothetical protein